MTERPRGATAPWSPLQAIGLGGFLAGLCDMSYALLWFSGVKGVLPLDAMHTKPHFAPWDTWLTGLFIHMFGIGLSISLSAAKTAPRA